MDTESKDFKEKRLAIMSRISHPETYYQHALTSKGIDYKALTHAQITVWVAQLKCIEADILIQMADQGEVTLLTDDLVDSLAILF